MFGRNKGKKGNYAYVVARVKAKKAQLMSDDAYQKMLLMSLPEISRFISESGYQKEITDLTAKFDGINLVEHATYQNMARIFEDILHSATGELHDILAIDLERWDIWNLKVILRGKSFGVDADSIREDLVLAGKLNEEDLEKLISLESQEEIIALYGRKTGRPIPQSVIDEVKEKKNLSIIEDFLDKNHYEVLLASIDPKDGGRHEESRDHPQTETRRSHRRTGNGLLHFRRQRDRQEAGHTACQRRDNICSGQ